MQLRGGVEELALEGVLPRFEPLLARRVDDT